MFAGLVRAKCVVTVIKLCQNLQKQKEVSGTEQVGVIFTMFLRSEQLQFWTLEGRTACQPPPGKTPYEVR